MQRDLFKLCADSLRTISLEKYDVRLKAAHAHELVAAYFGYPSKNAMLADKNYPVTKLGQAKIIVMARDAFIDDRRKQLKELPLELPDSYALGEWVYAPLFSEEWWSSSYPPFRSFAKLAVYLFDRHEACQSKFYLYQDIPMKHRIEVKHYVDSVEMEIVHAHKIDSGEMLGVGKTFVSLPRVAGKIGFTTSRIYVEIWTGGAKKIIDFQEAQS